MAARYLFRMGFCIALLWGVAAIAQGTHWTYEHRFNLLSGRVSDSVVVQGHYLAPLPTSPDAGTPTFGVSCSGGNFDVIVISTGVVIDDEFGASPKIDARIDNQKPTVDRAVPAIRPDSKSWAFLPQNRIGGTDMLFAKKYLVSLESYGARIAEMEFEIPSDSPLLLRYCGIMKPKQRLLN